MLRKCPLCNCILSLYLKDLHESSVALYNYHGALLGGGQYCSCLSLFGKHG